MAAENRVTTPGGALAGHLPAVTSGRGRRGRPGWAFTLAATVLLGVLLGRFVFVGSDSPAPPPVPTADRSTEAEVASLQARLRAVPDDPGALTDLGVAYLSRAKETGDPTWYAKAGQALDRSAALRPDQINTLVAQGLLALALHDFSGALELGTRARSLAPGAADPLGVVVDAHIELGHYPEAVAAAQDMVDRRPSLASLARVSHVRELTGDQAGATTAMAQAVAAGSGSLNDVAYVQSLLGDLHLARGDLDAADVAYTKALSTQNGYAAAEAGRAEVAAARGDLAGAAARLEPLVTRLPDPAWLALLGDVYTALGRDGDAGAQYGLVRGIEQLNAANGVSVDFEVARFEADHANDPGASPAAIVDQARAALAQRPTVFAEDALGWALRQAGQPEEALAHARAAVRLGTADALLWWHLARIEADLGRADDARRDLGTALSMNPHLSVRDLAPARALASELGIPL